MSVAVDMLDIRFTRAVDRYVLNHPQGTPFHETRWLDLVRTTFGFGNQTLVAMDGTEIRGVLPLALVSAPVTGRRLVSVPFGVYGGVLASDPETIAALDDAACQLARKLHVRYIELRYLGEGHTDHASSLTHETYRKQLPATPDEVLGTIPRKARAEVRKARKRHGMKLVNGRELLNSFYELYCVNKRGLGSPVFPRSYFRKLLDLFGHRALLHGIEYEGQIVTAVLSITAGGVIYPYYSGTADGMNRLGANNALYASLMEEAVQLGFDLFDFGRSRIGSGAASFKQHMGFEPTPLKYQFYFPHGGRPPQLSPDNPSLAVPQRILSALPMWLARGVGPALMRHVP